MHYTILANYFWLLAEGIYLQILLSFPMADCKENKYFPFFMAGGWGKAIDFTTADDAGDLVI